MRSILRRHAVGLAFLVGISVPACKRSPPPSEGPAVSATTRSAELATPDPRPDRSTSSSDTTIVEVPSDQDVLVATGKGSRPIVYLHGMCSDPRSDLEAWAPSVRSEGTIIALFGDASCP